jgi:hypothetical protein
MTWRGNYETTFSNSSKVNLASGKFIPDETAATCASFMAIFLTFSGRSSKSPDTHVSGTRINQGTDVHSCARGDAIAETAQSDGSRGATEDEFEN